MKRFFSKKLLFAIVPILLLLGGWGFFSKYIRPYHYQLLFPYNTRYGKTLAETETRKGSDGRLQILIPAGEALVGNGPTEQTVTLGDYWIDQIPVTIGSYKSYCKEAKNSLPPSYRGEDEKYYREKRYEILPVTYVGWNQAEAYCEYYGGHLPTEAQWEKAARGPEGIVLYWDDSCKAFDHANYDGFYRGLTPAGWLPKGKTYYGLLDMSGNVREWVLDSLLDENQPAHTEDWQEILKITEKDAGKILKGGSYTDDVSHLRLFARDAHDPHSPGINRGFRCVYEK